jgi:membrane fusion protein (multidrug efflux system)
MSALFSRTIRSLRADDQRASVAGVLLGATLVGAWLAWLFLARVVRYETSDSARLEVGRAAHRVEAPVEGKVSAVHLALGAEVEAGEALLQLDDGPLRLDLDEKRARLAASAAQLEPLRAQIAADQQALRETQEAGRSEVDEARARVREADAVARRDETEAERTGRLRREGLASEADAARVAAEAQARRAAAEAQQIGVLRIDAAQRNRGSVLRAEIARLGREATALEGEALALQAAIEALLGAVAQRRIVAPIAGRIGEIAELRAGAYVRGGALVATIVPRGELRVVAAFAPAVVGRLRAGQPARVRLDAFPWTEYGAVRAAVASVATEGQNGGIRVELAIEPSPASAIPMQHGLAGVAVIEVERVSPATLLLRAAGQLARTARAGGG